MQETAKQRGYHCLRHQEKLTARSQFCLQALISRLVYSGLSLGSGRDRDVKAG